LSEETKRTVQDRAQETLVRAREFVSNTRDQEAKAVVVAMGVAIRELLRKLESQALLAGVLVEAAGRMPTSEELAAMGRGKGRMVEWEAG
jgi:hypothetical protein